MSRGNLALTNRTNDNASSKATTTSPDLDRAVELLAEGIQTSMRSLYNLQLALINSPNRRGLNSILEEWTKIREFFRTDWESDISFLQLCYNYADEYISLCEFAMTLPEISKTSSLPSDVLNAAKDVYRGVTQLKGRHDKLSKQLRRHGLKVSSLLGISPHKTEDMIDRQKTRMLGASINQEVFRPTGASSLVESYTSLDQIGTSLGDITVFWRDHIDFLVNILSQRKTAKQLTLNELQISVETWKHHQSALLAAISSISESSDAVTVNPVSTQKRQGPRTGRMSVRIVLGFILGR